MVEFIATGYGTGNHSVIREQKKEDASIIYFLSLYALIWGSSATYIQENSSPLAGLLEKALTDTLKCSLWISLALLNLVKLSIKSHNHRFKMLYHKSIKIGPEWGNDWGSSKNRSPSLGDAFGPLELELKQQEDSFAPGQGCMFAVI